MKFISLREYASKLGSVSLNPPTQEYIEAARHRLHNVIIQVLDNPIYRNIPVPPDPADPDFAAKSQTWISSLPKRIWDETVIDDP
jgi:hypothetical protein